MSERINRQNSVKIVCTKCRHYYITWEKSFPYGCRAMGFKSKSLPSAKVLAASGKECLLFQKK